MAYNLLHKLGNKQEPLVRPGDRVSPALVQLHTRPPGGAGVYFCCPSPDVFIFSSSSEASFPAQPVFQGSFESGVLSFHRCLFPPAQLAKQLMFAVASESERLHPSSEEPLCLQRTSGARAALVLASVVF